MKRVHIITPVKDSIESTLETIKAIQSSEMAFPHTYTVYNDFSTDENTAILEKASKEWGFRLVNLKDITDHPSPNYLLVLQTCQKEAIEDEAGMIIVESDVTVCKDTLQRLVEGVLERPDCGIAASVTVDEQGVINYPYKHMLGKENQVIDTKKHCSFCCSVLTPALLKAFDFNTLDPEKNWYDVTISHESLDRGLKNYVFTTLPVIHRPHQSRPWKLLKYKNPIKYYWIKFTKGMDKI